MTMDISSLTKAAQAAQTTETPSTAETGGVALPKTPADPRAQAEFQEAMQGPGAVDDVAQARGLRPDAAIQAPNVQVQVREVPASDVRAHGVEDMEPNPAQAREDMRNLIASLGQGDLSHADLYRVQVMASMASIDAQRNSSAVKSMDQGLKTLLKDSG